MSDLTKTCVKALHLNRLQSDFQSKYTNSLISVNIDIVLPFTGFHDLLNVREEKMHVRLAESVE